MAYPNLVHGHRYRGALKLSPVESLFSGSIANALDGIGFEDIDVYDEIDEVPATFGYLKTLNGATHWAEGVFMGATTVPDTTGGAVQPADLPPQVISFRDDGVDKGAAGTPPDPDPPDPKEPPPPPGAKPVPKGIPGIPGTRPRTADKGMSTGQKIAIATVGLGVTVGLGTVLVLHFAKSDT